jgi:outer membrane lipoprotein-sorting protein
LLALLPAAGLIVLSYGAHSGFKAPPAEDERVALIGRAAESPEQIIAKMARTYAGARSYSDEGEVITVYTGEPAGKRTHKRPFSTKFVRPKLYRYEFWERRGEGEDERNRYVIWSDAAPERSKAWWTLRPAIDEKSLAMAIGAAVGVSGSSSNTVPGLLMPDVVTGSQLRAMRDLKLVGEETVEEALCDKVEGKNVRGEPMTVWVDKATCLVRKILSKSQFPTFATEETTIYRPRVNVEISPREFEFEPSQP